MTKRINLWSSPRNISTAMMYSFAQRPDTTVVDEPLFAHFLTKATVRSPQPAEDEAVATMENDGNRVVDWMMNETYPTEVVVFKQMTHHLVQLDRDFLYKMENVLLIRDPRAIINSYARVTPEPLMEDIGVEMQAELYEQLSAKNKLAAILDTREVLLNPEGVLRQLCEALDLPFTKKMLSWPAGPRPEDGCWAPYWYHNLHQSTGFQPYAEKEIHLSPRNEALAERCRPYYEKLHELAIKA